MQIARVHYMLHFTLALFISHHIVRGLSNSSYQLTTSTEDLTLHLCPPSTRPRAVDFDVIDLVCSEALMNVEPDCVIQRGHHSEIACRRLLSGIVDCGLTSRKIMQCWRCIEDVEVGQLNDAESLKSLVGRIYWCINRCCGCIRPVFWRRLVWS